MVPKSLANQQREQNRKAVTETQFLNAPTVSHKGLFGSTGVTYTKDGKKVTGTTQTLNPSLKPITNTAVQNLKGGAINDLPGDAIDWDAVNATTDKIFDQGMSSYDNLAQVNQAQRNAMKRIEFAERGVPMGSEIDQTHNFNTSLADNLARGSYEAQLYQMMPQWQQQLIDNETTMHNQPYDQTAKDLGLLGGIQGLTPEGRMLPQTTVQAPDQMAAELAKWQMKRAQSAQDDGAMGGLLQTGLGLLGGFMG